MADKTGCFMKSGIRQQLKEQFGFEWPLDDKLNLVQLTWNQIVDVLKKFNLKQIYLNTDGISSATTFRTTSSVMFCHFQEAEHILTARVRRLK